MVPAVSTAAACSVPVPLALSRDQLTRQTIVLTSRYLRLQLADPKNLLLLFAQAPIIALMIAAQTNSRC